MIKGDNLMRKAYVLLGMVMALTLVFCPGSAQALMWVGAQGGVNVLANTDVDVNVFGSTFTAHDVRFDNPQAIGGLQIGYAFVKEGFLGYNYPEWMKYFAFIVDFTYNTYEVRSQDVSVTGISPEDGEKVAQFLGNKMHISTAKGMMAVMSFLFMGRYGFFPDSEVPFGRLQPYVAVGPGVAFTSLDPGAGIGTTSSVDVALVTEGGVRWMALKNVALDAAFRYRWFEPKFTFTSAALGNVTVKPDAIHSFTALFRVSYLF